MQQMNKIRKRKVKAIEQYIEDLEHECDKFRFVRESQHLFDAFTFYLVQPHLTEVERDEIRQAMTYLSGGD